MCVGCIHTHVFLGEGHRFIFGISLLHRIVLRQSCSLNLVLAISARLSGQPALTTIPGLLKICSAIQAQVLRLLGQALYMMSHFPILSLALDRIHSFSMLLPNRDLVSS